MNIEPVILTDKAIEEIKYIMANKGIPEDYGLRVGIKGGGCGAMGYIVGFDKKSDEDISYQKNEIPIFIEKKHMMYLIGMELDFQENPEQRGFVLNKPTS